jgi:predicted Rossmann fold flavoprotein
MKELEINPNKNISTVLEAFIPQRMAPDLLSLSGILPEKKCNQITKLERKSAVDRLKDFRFTVRSTRPIEEAMVTRGGVSVKELDPKTMESKLVPGLFFAGEVIDVDAGTGGYNLQAAFSTGYAAAKGIISGGGK